MKTIKLYTNGCPKGIVLKNKLANIGVNFTECSDISEMERIGITSTPMLQIEEDRPLLSFSESIKWLSTGCNDEAYNDLVQNREVRGMELQIAPWKIISTSLFLASFFITGIILLIALN